MRKYYISRGSFQGTMDDRADKWYVCIEGESPQKVGGFATKKEALREKAECEAADAAWDVFEKIKEGFKI